MIYIPYVTNEEMGHRQVDFSKATALGGRENGAGKREHGVQRRPRRDL